MLKKIHSQFNETPHKSYLIAAVIFLIIILLIIISRISAYASLRAHTREAAITSVSVTIAIQESGADKLILPGNVWAWHEAPIFARTNGYVQKWYVDIGSKVKAGELLALIETPELDAQQRQAAADLQTAIANNKLAQTTAKRWVDLVKTDSVSKQERDEKVSTAQAQQAIVFAAKANLDHLNELVSFQRVIAPFDGVITARATDIGALINAGSSATEKPLFRIAQTSPLRIYVKVPQNFASRMQKDMTVSLHFAAHPHQEFSAKLLSTAKAIDPQTRTLLAQFTTENKEGLLLPGGYTEVWFSFPIPSGTIRLPVNTLLFQAQGLQVAVVDKEDNIILKSVRLNRDFGDSVEVATGVNSGDRIVLNPPDSITQGQKVRVVS